MKKKISNQTKKIATAGLMSALMIAPFMSPLLVNAVDPNRPNDFDIILTKTRYVTRPGQPAPIINNRGSVYENPLDKENPDRNGLTIWDSEKYGEVKFGYKLLTKDNIANIPGIGEIKRAPGHQGHYVLNNEQIKKIQAHAVAHPYNDNKDAESLLHNIPDGNKQGIQGDGTATIHLRDVLLQTEYVAILIEEIKQPDAFVSEKSAPIVLPLPMTNAEGNGRMNEIRLYPKNGTQERSIKLTKKTNGGRLLPGAKFDLYKGEPGQGTRIQEGLTASEDKAEIVVSGVTKGKYYFVEVDSDVAIYDNEIARPGDILIDWNARNDANNKLVFTVDDDTVFDQEGFLKAEIINYEAPRLVKEQTTQANLNAFNTKIGFKGTIDIPQNLDGSTITNGDTVTTELPYTVLKYKDTASANLKFLQNEEIKVAVGQDELVLTKVDDYTVTFPTENSMEVNLTEAGIEKLFPHKGKKLYITYSMMIKDTAVPTTKEVNKATLEYSNDPTSTLIRNFNDETNIKVDVDVYGKKFKKVDDGVFNTGLLNNPIQGAEFLVKQGNEYIIGLNQTEGQGFIKRAATEDLTETIRLARENGWLFTSGQDGLFEVKGLPQGEYFLKEVKAPAEYQIRTDDIMFTISADSYETQNLMNVENTRRPELPLTGSERTIIVVGAGLSMALIGVFALSRKKKEQQ